jgi:hypothetical protein
MGDRLIAPLGAALGAAIGVLFDAPGFAFLFWAAIGATVATLVRDSWYLRRRKRERRDGRLSTTTGEWSGARIREQLRRAGVDERRAGGGTLLTEPVLVVWRTGLLASHTEIFDRSANLLAGSAPHPSPDAGRVRALLQTHPLSYTDRSGRELLTVAPNGRWNATAYRATGADGSPLGEVSADLKSITAPDGSRASARRAGRFARLGIGRCFEIRDAEGLFIGRIRRTASSSWGSSCHVVEVADGAPSAIRALIPAIDEAVDDQLTPKGGGG